MNDREDFPGLTLFALIAGAAIFAIGAFVLMASIAGCVNGKPDARTVARIGLDAVQIACILERTVDIEALREPCKISDAYLDEARKLVGVRNQLLASGALRPVR